MTMRRTPFRRPALPRTRAAVIPIPADLRDRINYGPAANSGPVLKGDAVQHAGYRRIVAGLRCIACGALLGHLSFAMRSRLAPVGPNAPTASPQIAASRRSRRDDLRP